MLFRIPWSEGGSSGCVWNRCTCLEIHVSCLPHPSKRYPTSCLYFHHNVSFRPARSKLHQANCSVLCGEVFCMKTKPVAGRGAVSLPGRAVLTLPSLVASWPPSPGGDMAFLVQFTLTKSCRWFWAEVSDCKGEKLKDTCSCGLCCILMCCCHLHSRSGWFVALLSQSCR